MASPGKDFEIVDNQDELVYQCIVCEFIVYEWGDEDEECFTRTVIVDENDEDHMSPDYSGEPPDDEEWLCPVCYEHLTEDFEEPNSRVNGECVDSDTKPSREFVFLAFQAWQGAEEVDDV